MPSFDQSLRPHWCHTSWSTCTKGTMAPWRQPQTWAVAPARALTSWRHTSTQSQALTSPQHKLPKLSNSARPHQSPSGFPSFLYHRVSGAESLPFPDNSLQLVTAGQACHWFDMPKFLKEVDRVLVPGGVVALYCYLLPRVVDPHLGERLSAMFSEVYDDLLAGCWGEGLKDVNDCYRDPKFTIPYPDSSRDDSHSLMTELSVAELTLFMTTWSGFNTYRERNGEAAAQKLLDDFQKKVMTTLGVSTPPENTRLQLDTHFPLLMGRKPRI
ncbi:putative methyltransferase DDB_G0268948 isoform X5 [Eriocheir sinensis]|uniref:putative methyltransferase DDB_G0268948 isoform X5 n=1 Tax=Eriocheir sinensis TaxID=95602 RepID=UPI0021C9E33B|nr:putative methyltransferase DDB_G0268948 isoform X5 [Eriocheir sinensis]XP_050733655.1 putative methyltransferase DDB_G0268948 isoform X5 [Eriocheir sinensis]XP_050733656.1 putative methyltransferase DDB_G0268948 isoform X5 [Eriocheir sinensis]XP_050733657.1 putative methyltransferase DDB_G0268948 isoform X5 [Eriocheir sinensis]XP_050733658.1 putative methyltransferase DDB_G0268948 isoform X5 [Eriocheir sinensis]